MSGVATVTTDVLPFEVINLTPQTVGAYGPEARPPTREPAANVRQPDAHVAVGPGDILKISIVERYAGGIFSTMQQGNVSLGSRQVSPDGTIDLPFAGKIHAAGKDLHQIESEILNQLGNKATEPQVVVELEADRTNTVMVSGEVARPGRLSLSDGVRTVVEAISRAGGPIYPAAPPPGGPARSSVGTPSPVPTGTGPTSLAPPPKMVGGPMQMQVVVRRKGRVIFDKPLSDLLDGGDMAIQKDDEVVVASSAQVVTVLGAVLRAGNVPLSKPDMTLAETLGEVSGLFDARSNATGVYVFRLLDTNGAKRDRAQVFRLDFSQAASVFIAQKFAIRPKDAIYVTNAPLAEYDKVLTPIYLTILTLGTARGF